MKQGIAIHHYPYRTSDENVRYFAAHGFDAISEHGIFFLEALRDPKRRAALAAAIRDTGVTFTVHHFLPNRDMRYPAELFREHMAMCRDWYDETGLLHNLSFDVFEDDRPIASKYVRIALDAFRGTDVWISLEDYGLTPEEKADVETLRDEPNFAYLMDLGHLNVRLTAGSLPFHCTPLENADEAAPLAPGDNSPEAFRRAILSKPRKVVEMHLHNNNGLADQHRYPEEGTIDMPGLARVLKELRYDGVVTLEIVPDYTGTPEEVAAHVAASDEIWNCIKTEFRLPPFHGTPNPARDEKVLRSFRYWTECLKKA